ncbi:MAG: ABC transporter permease subunit [Anaerocolumna sp.]
MTLFLRELKANRKAFIIWAVCIVLLVLTGMGKYSAYSKGSDSIAIFNDLPHTVKALFGMSSFDVTTISGYFAMLFLYIEITVCIHAALLGAGILSKEERDKTSEFLMVKPITRGSVVTSKLVAAALNVLLINIITWVSSVSIVSIYNKGESINNELSWFFVSMLFVQFIYLSFGLFLSTLLTKPKSAGTIAVNGMLVGYIISRVTDITDQLNVLNLLSPFKYFSYVAIVKGVGLQPVAILCSLLLIVILLIGTYILYEKRELRA